MRQGDHAHRTRSVVVGSVVDGAVDAQAVVIVVTAEQNGFVLQLRIAAFDDPGNVVRKLALALYGGDVQLGFGIAQRGRLRLQRGIDGTLKLRRLFAGSSE